MKKRGFTLIELLAVIVILAIIALIATPIVMNVIESSKKGAAKSSADNYIRAVETEIVEKRIDGPIADGEYKIMADGSLCPSEGDCTEDTKINVQVSGTKPDEGGTILIQNGEVVDKLKVETSTGEEIKTTIMSFGNYNTSYNEEGKIEVTKKEESEEITEGKLCTPNKKTVQAYVKKEGFNLDSSDLNNYELTPVGLLASEEGAYTPGVTYTCNFIDNNKTNNMTFFVLSSTETAVTLISGSNLGETVAWNATGMNLEEPITANAILKDRTSEWRKLTDEQKETIKLPTTDEIAKVVNKTFFEDKVNELPLLPTWLTSHTTTSVCHGYWTSSRYGGYSDIKLAWFVQINRKFKEVPIAQDDFAGIRPVITLSKNDLG